MLHDAVARRRLWRGGAHCLARHYVLIPALILCLALVAFGLYRRRLHHG